MLCYLHNRHVVPGVQLDVVHLRDEDGGHCDEERCAVHVDGGTNGQDELGDAWVHLVLLHATEGDGEGGGPATEGETRGSAVQVVIRAGGDRVTPFGMTERENLQ